jgi:hypothetical protein
MQQSANVSNSGSRESDASGSPSKARFLLVWRRTRGCGHFCKSLAPDGYPCHSAHTSFRNSKPTESDLEDEEDDDDDDEDPSSWFEPDPDEDGLKGQNIVDPDGDPEEADLSHLIRIDERVLRAVYPASDIPM